MADLDGLKSPLTYQMLSLGLALSLCASLILVEIVIRKYHVLPVVFSSILTVKKKRTTCYGSDITDNPKGRVILSGCCNILRICTVLAFSYIWHFAIIESYTRAGSKFPSDLCALKFDCFSTLLRWNTIFDPHALIPIDCAAGTTGFQDPQPPTGSSRPPSSTHSSCSSRRTLRSVCLSRRAPGGAWSLFPLWRGCMLPRSLALSPRDTSRTLSPVGSDMRSFSHFRVICTMSIKWPKPYGK